MSSPAISPVSSLAYETISFPGTGKHQTLNLNYVIRKGNATKKSGCAPLTFRVNVSGTITSKDVEIDTRQKINPEHWDFEKKCLKPTCPDYETTTAQLAELKTYLNSLFCILTTDSKELSPAKFKEEYELKTNPAKAAAAIPPVYTLLTTIDQLIVDFERKAYLPEDHKEKRSKETLKQWCSTRSKLIEYLGYLHTGEKPFISRKKRRDKKQQAQYIADGKQYDLPLSEIKPAFAEEFFTYLTEDRSTTIGSSAAIKQIKNTKRVFTYAIGKDYLKINPIAYYNTTDEPNDVIPLEWNEVQLLANLTGLSPRLERIRDCFMIQIYTGFAFQDLKALTVENIHRDHDTGVYFLCRERNKTGIDEIVPLVPEVKQYIDKYLFDPECRAEGVLFPVPSNTKFNAYLKELQELARLTKRLHTHLARHTYAHLMLNRYGFALEIVSKMLGHKSIRTTQRYCKVSMQLIAQTVAPHLVVEKPKLTVIHSIRKVYINHGVISEAA